MHGLEVTRERVAAAFGVGAAAACGLVLVHPHPRSILLVGAVAFAAYAVVCLEAPLVALATLAAVLGVASEDVADDRGFGVRELAFDQLVSVVNLSFLLVLLLTLVLALTVEVGARHWPGMPATAALVLLVVCGMSMLLRGELGDSLLVLRPFAFLFLAILVGYWIALRHGSRVPLKILVLASMVALPVGLYNVAAGSFSFYDSSVIYLIGLCSVLVLFRAVDIGFAYVPYLAVSALVIVLSLRRGAILGIAVTILIAGILLGRGTFRAGIAVGAGTILAVELLAPGAVLTQVGQLVGYFTGASGQDYAVNYRRYETSNAWLNVKESWLTGIGPVEPWSLYRTFDGEFFPDNQTYVHNSYLSVWLRFGLAGILAFGAFLAVTAATLIRRAAPASTVIVGASIVGLAVTLVTASFLTTTTRWPLTVGLFVGIALAAMRERPPTVGEQRLRPAQSATP